MNKIYILGLVLGVFTFGSYAVESDQLPDASTGEAVPAVIGDPAPAAPDVNPIDVPGSEEVTLTPDEEKLLTELNPEIETTPEIPADLNNPETDPLESPSIQDAPPTPEAPVLDEIPTK